jgi:hypothetical protein
VPARASGFRQMMARLADGQNLIAGADDPGTA